MNILDAIIQGIVQGLTEFLPVSSSGHLAISQHILGVTEDNLFFNVMLHVGTLVAVVVVYYKLIGRLIAAFFKLLKNVFTGKFKWSKMDGDQNLIMMLIIGLVPLFLLFAPLPGSGGLTPKALAEVWAGNSGYFIVVGISLLFTSLLLVLGINASKWTAKRYAQRGINKRNGVGRTRYNVIDAVSVGIAQTFAAVFPGLSRSGSTLAVAQMRGINKQAALDYSFVLGIPAILAAAVLEGKDAIEADAINSADLFPVLIGMITSAVVGFFAIKLFKWMLAKDRMHVFVIYTAIAGAAVFIISLIELSTGTNLFTGAPLAFG